MLPPEIPMLGHRRGPEEGRVVAKIVITIEDLPNGKVKVVASPNAEQMIRQKMAGHDWTAAHGYAFCALNEVRKQSKLLASKIIIPKVFH